MTNHRGSRRDVLLLLNSPGYVQALNSALAGTGTAISPDDVHRPLGAHDDREYELLEFCRQHLDGRFDYHQIEGPVWWIVKRNARVRTPNLDLLSTATIEGQRGLLLVEAKAHHGELETGGKAFKPGSNAENHRMIGESVGLADRALNAICPGFRLSRDAHYQVSNRVAWGWRLASLGVAVTVFYLGFLKDPYWPRDMFRSAEDWARAAREYLGNVFPAGALNRRLPCLDTGSLLISAAALPAIPPDGQ